jgi:hypothetical protein
VGWVNLPGESTLLALTFHHFQMESVALFVMIGWSFK